MAGKVCLTFKIPEYCKHDYKKAQPALYISLFYEGTLNF